LISRLSPFFRDTGDALPSTIKVTQEQITKYWEHWLFWKMCGRRVEAFVMALGWKSTLPRAMLEVFFELDNFMDRMEAQKLRKELQRKQNG
jgi:hypothetical protein